MFEAPENIFRPSKSCEAVNNSSLRPEQVESSSWGLSVYSIEYFQDILCKQANGCELLNRPETMGTHGQMAVTHLNNRYTYTVKKTWKQEKATFENIIRSAAAWVAPTTPLVFESLLFEETGRFVSFTADKIVVQWPLIWLYLLHPTSYHNSNSSFIWR